jgi:hypothetical protein
MASTKYGIAQFRTEIRNLIAEIKSCIQSQDELQDREFDLQRQAFHERCDQAHHLTRSLESGQPDESEIRWSLRDGDAHRIEESLKLSLDYFRHQQ